MREKWWLRIVLLGVVIALMAPQIDGQAQPDPPPSPLRWDDAPQTPILRHEGDAQVRLGQFLPSEALGPFVTPAFDIGDRTIFNITIADDPQEFELFYRSQHAYFWFLPDSEVDIVALQAAATRFDTEIWPTNRALFGDSAMLGVDGDPHIHLVHLQSLYPGLAGFFSPDDQCAVAICARSNQRDVLYLMLDYGPLNSDLYLSTITHEFQHMLQFTVDGNEARWLDEGYSQLAEYVQGFTADPINQNNINRYLENTNIVLNSWSNDYNEQSRHYGAGYLMAVYLYERYGEDFIYALTHNRADGLAGIDRTLLEWNAEERIDDVLVDWWIANYANDPSLADGRYGYVSFDTAGAISPIGLVADDAIIRDGLLYPYGVEYLRLDAPGTYQLNFSANTTTDLIRQTIPHSGGAVWWSNNATASATALTRTFDLSSVESATLKYWLVGQTGNFSGHLHVLASRDGVVWELLRGNKMDFLNRFSSAPGPHYTNTDGIWIADFVDLSPYAGGLVQVRFEYVTNNALAGPGFFLDDFAIPELAWSDDVESGTSGWDVQGFIRTNGQVRQDWAIAVLDPTANNPVVIIPVQDGVAQATITVPADGVTIMVGSLAPFTHLASTYHLALTLS